MEGSNISIKREIRSSASRPRGEKKDISDNLNLPLKEPEKEQDSKLVK